MHLINGNGLHQQKKDYTKVGSAVTPLLFEVTIILFQRDIKLSYSEFQHSKMTDKVDNTEQSCMMEQIYSARRIRN